MSSSKRDKLKGATNKPSSGLESFHSSASPSSLNENFADLLITYLEQLDVEYVFGIPGGAIEPFYNALARSERRQGPRPITARHESGAAFMAEGYYAHTGKLGVCCATTGPGVTNLITGVASAYANSVPMLVISAQTALSSFGRHAFQESSCTGVNALALLAPCTRYNTLISHPDQFELKLVTAIMTAFGPMPGPVHLSIPIDVMNARPASLKANYQIQSLIPTLPVPGQEQLRNLTARLRASKKIVFVVGEGASASIGAILTSAQLLNAQLVTTPHGKGLINPYHPGYRGVIGFAGHQSASAALIDPEVDTVVCIGSALTEWASNGWDKQSLLNSRMIHIDQQEHNFSLTPMASMHVRGDIGSVFDHLVKELAKDLDTQIIEAPASMPRASRELSLTLDDPDSFESNAAPIHPARLMRDLPRFCPPNTRYFADVGASFAWSIHYLHPFDRRMKGVRAGASALYCTCIEFSAMGWAIGCSVGAALALKGQPVVCITGDGSLLMNGQEMTVAVQERLPIIYVILNDGALGMVKHGQRLTGAEAVAFEIPRVDFVAFAKSMGVLAFAIKSPEDLKVLSQLDLDNLDGPILLDVHIDAEAVPPITKRTQTIKALS